MKLAHIINPVNVSPDRDLYWQQPIVFESLRKAQNSRPEDSVWQYACFYPEDEDVSPPSLFQTEYLEREIGDYQDFKVKRKLPLFQEILEKLYDYSDADYFIQTNADICIMPYFYDLVRQLIDDGCKSFCINKRILPEIEQFKSVENLPLMYSHLGSPHAGHDCFVFPRKLFKKIDLGLTCMGTPWSETPLIAHLIALDPTFYVFKHAHVTFHIGDRRDWIDSKYNDYRANNLNQFATTSRQLINKKGKGFLSHPTMEDFLFKLRFEINHMGKGDYDLFSKDCHWFIDKGYGIDEEKTKIMEERLKERDRQWKQRTGAGEKE